MTENLTKKPTEHSNQRETLTPMEIQPEPNRAYKDRLFRIIFKEKEESLQLYNAINRTNYQNPDDLTSRFRSQNLSYSTMAQMRFRRGMGFREAIQKAVDQCIKDGILADFLKKNKAEVISMGLYEYDEEKFINAERKYAKEKGVEEGLEQGRLERNVQLICKKLKKRLSIPEIADLLEEAVTSIQDICDVAAKYHPDYDIDKIMAELLNRQATKH